MLSGERATSRKRRMDHTFSIIFLFLLLGLGTADAQDWWKPKNSRDVGDWAHWKCALISLCCLSSLFYSMLMLTCRGHGTNGFAGTASKLIAQMNRMQLHAAASTAPGGQIQLCTCSPCCRLRSRADWLGKSNDWSVCKSLAYLDIFGLCHLCRVILTLGIAWHRLVSVFRVEETPSTARDRSSPLASPPSPPSGPRTEMRHKAPALFESPTFKPCPETVSLDFGKMLKKSRSTSKFLKTLECCIWICMHMIAYVCILLPSQSQCFDSFFIRFLRSLTVTVYLTTRVWLAAFPAFTQRRNVKMRISLTAVIWARCQAEFCFFLRIQLADSLICGIESCFPITETWLLECVIWTGGKPHSAHSAQSTCDADAAGLVRKLNQTNVMLC